MSRIDLTLRFRADDPELRSRLDQAAHSLIRRFAAPRLVVRLDGGALTDGAVQALVAALRRLREVGGAIHVVPETDEIAAALAVTGLDRVLAFPLGEDDPPVRPPRKRTSAATRVAAAFAAAVALAVAPAGAQAPVGSAATPTEPAAIVARIEERNPALSSYQGRVHIDLRLISFPFLRQHLDGTTYFKRPDNYEVVFDRVPGYAKGFERLFTDVGDPASWGKKFTIAYEGERTFAGRQDLGLRMVQRVRGMIDHEDVLVDPKTWSIDRVDYYYYNGGHISMTQTFRDIAGHSLLAAQQAEIAIPHVRAVAGGTYDEYRTNVAVSDDVFAKGQKQ